MTAEQISDPPAGREKPEATSMRKLTPAELSRHRAAIGAGDKAALAEAGSPGATAESIERARRTGYEIGHRIAGISIDDRALTALPAAERAMSAKHWRERANDPDVGEQERTEAARQAVIVQGESDNLAGVLDPGVRPEGYQPISTDELAAAKAQADSVRRV